MNDGDGSRVFNIDDGNSAKRIDVSITRTDAYRRRRRGASVAAGRSSISKTLAVSGSTISGNSTGTSSSSDGGGIL